MNAALIVAGIIFLLVSLLHLLRLIVRLEVRMGTFVVPLWVSVFGFLFPLSLSIWMFVSARS